MIRFEEIHYLWLLLLVPAMALWFAYNKRWRKKQLEAPGQREAFDRLFAGVSFTKIQWKKTLRLLALACIIIGLANPQLGTKMKEVKRRGIDIMVALDVSNSMLATDFFPNRLERSKQALNQLIDGLKGDRIGIVVFAGDAYVQLPLSSDYAAAKMFVQAIETGIIERQGTDLAAALDLTLSSFDKSSESERVLIVITDGENHQEDAVQVAKQADELGVSVHAIGMATAQGAPIPVLRQGKVVGYKKDKSGQTVISRLNEAVLQEICKEANGLYVRASSSDNGLRLLLAEMAGLEKKEYESQMVSDYEDRFQFFLIPALLLLALEMGLTNRRERLKTRLQWFKVKH